MDIHHTPQVILLDTPPKRYPTPSPASAEIMSQPSLIAEPEGDGVRKEYYGDTIIHFNIRNGERKMGAREHLKPIEQEEGEEEEEEEEDEEEEEEMKI